MGERQESREAPFALFLEAAKEAEELPIDESLHVNPDRLVGVLPSCALAGSLHGLGGRFGQREGLQRFSRNVQASFGVMNPESTRTPRALTDVRKISRADFG